MADQTRAGASVPVAPLLRSVPRLDEGKNGQRGGPSLSASVMNPLVDREWDDTISAHPDATIFHSTAWARVLADTYGHRPSYVDMSLHGDLLGRVRMLAAEDVP